MLRINSLIAAVSVFTIWTAPALSQGHGKHLPPNHINPKGLSQGLQTWWFGPGTPAADSNALATGRFLLNNNAAVPKSSNVDAADPNEDVAPGQSETAIGASGRLVMVAWNDASGFFVQPTTTPEASGTGVGFSRDGGKTFTDLIGLPNNNSNQLWSGDPSVVAIDGGRFFIVSSLYVPIAQDCSQGPSIFAVAVSVGVVNPDSVEFTNPIIAANSGDFCSGEGLSGVLDKPYMAFDQKTRTLAISFSRFSFFGFSTGQIEVVKAHVPASASFLEARDFSPPIVIWPEEPNVENTGAYPALAYNSSKGADDIYVAWERNAFTNSFDGDPFIYIHAAEVLPGKGNPKIVGAPGNPIVVTLNQRNSGPFGGVKSLDLVPVAGYSRGTSNDFPRISWNAVKRQVIIVWNDASTHPLGDIFLRAYSPGLVNATLIHKINDDKSGTLHMFPAVCSRTDGAIVTSWYDRRNFPPGSANTNLFTEVRHTIPTNGTDFKVTDVSSDWFSTSSIISPNFGDYTDNACTGTTTYYTWSDGRLGLPQPFVAHHTK